MEATMKKKLDADEDTSDDHFEKQKKKTQTDFMKHLTDLTQQAVETLPQTEAHLDETLPPVNRIVIKFYDSELFIVSSKESETLPDSSQVPSRLARQTTLRRPPVTRPPIPSKPTRIPVKLLTTVVSEPPPEHVEIRAKTPRQFSSSFTRLIEKLKELNWFEDQYPSVSIDVCLI